MNLSPLELNDEIDRIEAGIVLREARVRGRVADLGQRVDAALPKVVAAGVVAGALGLLVLWLRPRRPVATTAPVSAAAAPGGWLHWITMAWPLVPPSLQAMVDLRLVMAIGKPLLAMFKRRQARPAPPPQRHEPEPAPQPEPPAGAAQTRG